MCTQVLRTCAFSLLTLTVAVLASSSALAQTTGPNGKIAYVVNMGLPDNTTDIWVMDADGTNQTDITNTPSVSEYNPIWSPDGTKIAYVTGDNIFSGVWTMNADGTSQTKLSTFSGVEFGPTWSPDSTRLALVRYVPGIGISIQFDIFVVAVDGSSDVNITNSDFDELEPSWSPDGKRIAFAGVRFGGSFTTWQIVTVDPDGSNEADLIVMDHENRSPNWSPDSTKLTFMAQFNNPCCETWQVWAMNSDGSGATNLSNDSTVNDMWPSWSPDGSLIIFSSTRNATCCGETNIFTMPAPEQLPPTFARAAGPLGVVKQLTTNGNSTDPDWARKAEAVCNSDCLRSRSIVFRFKRNDPGIELQANIQVRNELRLPVAGALVSVKWTAPGGRSKTAQKPTDSNGVVGFQVKGPHGTYIVTVTNITKQGATFDPAQSVLSKTIIK
jgi:Tol biopolymer transport system component